ncbi:glutathione peroxidase [Cellvibrio japonicus]|uniref:Glutathione peroxidase n=1 Tax=Cellvibrio japonicus (strain Ueda107) TaxID=498211 RepID=B3PEG2_CELJU|nr:glutathione peroxidase [Cellvibrio japonicus]ACE84719.1 putative glutathione peroxidase [Cellvibrio japonicus Ueda107]
MLIKAAHCYSGLLFGALLAATGAQAACPDYLQGEYRKLHSQASVDLCELTENKPVLVVNTASHCGFTSQFKEMEAVYQKYKDKGLVVVGFASDDFKQEDKDEEKAAEICYLNYGVTFTMLAPTHVTGDQANDLFKTLAKESTEPKWNFNKYLLDKNGKLIQHFGSRVKPDAAELTSAIEKVL